MMEQVHLPVPFRTHLNISLHSLCPPFSFESLSKTLLKDQTPGLLPMMSPSDYHNTIILPGTSYCPSYSAHHRVREGMTYPRSVF
jgi:hypothetical protein